MERLAQAGSSSARRCGPVQHMQYAVGVPFPGAWSHCADGCPFLMYIDRTFLLVHEAECRRNMTTAAPKAA